MASKLIRIAKRTARRVIGWPIFGPSILMYHRIAESSFDPFNISVSPQDFARQLEGLRTRTVLSLQEFVNLHIRDKLPHNAVAITFDDGYACNAVVAAPILTSFGYPATFFVISEAIGSSEEFWWDELEYIVHADGFDHRHALRLLQDTNATAPNLIADDVETRQGIYRSLWTILLDRPTQERRNYLCELRSQTGLLNQIRQTHRPMKLSELRVLGATHLFEIGAHSASHPSLPTLSPAEQEREIVASRLGLELLLGKPIQSFSYPFGHRSKATREIVADHGFAYAVTADHRKVRLGDSRFELPRRQALTRSHAAKPLDR